GIHFSRRKLYKIKKELYERSRGKMFSRLVHAHVWCRQRVCILVDGWTAPSAVRCSSMVFVALVCRDAKGEQILSYPVAGRSLRLREKETATTLQAILLEVFEMLASHDISVSYICSDNASNMLCARRRLSADLNRIIIGGPSASPPEDDNDHGSDLSDAESDSDES
ncbi:hypothetical protein FOZ61_004292, partial [Perkinsus olseni]